MMDIQITEILERNGMMGNDGSSKIQSTDKKITGYNV